ncbi:hypothetical protein NDU88_008497 [Pleurodeles waltl]|uniref:Uncharacterized protein n=1 Tax=Pleurodeles waltl TaxID=8319 RepID=A0AAV7RUW7_PLEWA|nr:hypothetical protein NDU88_008497 [Pleurodeles waltl]
MPRNINKGRACGVFTLFGACCGQDGSDGRRDGVGGEGSGSASAAAPGGLARFTEGGSPGSDPPGAQGLCRCGRVLPSAGSGGQQSKKCVSGGGGGGGGGPGASSRRVYGRVRVGESSGVPKKTGREERRQSGATAPKRRAGPRVTAGKKAWERGQFGEIESSAVIKEKGKEKAACTRGERLGFSQGKKVKAGAAGDAAPEARAVTGILAVGKYGKVGPGDGACSGSRDAVSFTGGDHHGVLQDKEAEGDPKVPLSVKWPTMLQWSSEEEGGELEGDRCIIGGGSPASSGGATSLSLGAGILEGEVGGGEEGRFEGGLEEDEGVGAGGRWGSSYPPGTPDLSWQGLLDYEEEDPGEQEAARVRWGEEKAGPWAASRMASSGRSRRRSGAADASTGPYGGVGVTPPVAAVQKEQRPGPSRRRSNQRGEYSSCVRCGGSGASVVEWEVRSEESLEEGELRNSESEYEWWESGGRGTSNPVRKLLQAQRLGARRVERRGERKGGEARTVQERPPLQSPGLDDYDVEELREKHERTSQVKKEEGLVDPLGENMFDPHMLQHPLSPQWTSSEHVAQYVQYWLRWEIPKDV